MELMAAPDRRNFHVRRDAGDSGQLQVSTDTVTVSRSHLLTFKLLPRCHMPLTHSSPQLRGERASMFPLRPNCGYHVSGSYQPISFLAINERNDWELPSYRPDAYQPV